MARPAAPAADRTDEAKRSYEQGAEAFAAGRNAEAIRYFRRAAALAPSAKLTYNIALAYSEMGDTGRALAEYRSYLRAETDPVLVGEVETRIRELELRLSEAGVQLLSVSSRPAGALVKIDAQPVGVTPWSGELSPGAHQLSLELADHERHEGTVWLASERAADVEVDLSPLPKPEPPRDLATGRVSALTWAFLGVGVAATAGGVAFELSRAASSERADRASSDTAAAEARGAADAKQMASLLLLGSGAAFLIGGGVLLSIDLGKSGGKDATARQAVLTFDAPCAPTFCGFVTHGRF